MIPVYKIITVYEYLYQRKYSQPDFTLPRTPRNLRLLGKFQRSLPVDSGESFIWNYSVYAFWCYEGLLTRRRIELNWIYGDKMLARYRSRSEEQIYYLQQYKESKGIRNPLTEKYSLTLSDEYKDRQRKMYWNTPRGYLNCLEFGGRLFEKANVYCKNCKYKKQCDDQSTRNL